MNSEALDLALEQAYVPPAPQPSPVEPMGAGVTQAMEDCALALARKHRLINHLGQLYCWNCAERCDWHVSLHCTPCRVEAIRQAPERRRQEWLDRRREQERARQQEQEQSRPRATGRGFRDG
ncbi:MAG TPA: hypothetical protein VFS67_30675 [Polyangiaceae bacterium]|nr:hypothetical protein [Polyangiaceae bacterium]